VATNLKTFASPTDPLRVPPHSVEAEQSTLGALMLEATAWDTVADVLTAQDFYRADHRLIFEAAAAVSEQGKPIDVLTLSEHLERHGKLEDAGGLAYLGTLLCGLQLVLSGALELGAARLELGDVGRGRHRGLTLGQEEIAREPGTHLDAITDAAEVGDLL
jgi:hypothetical protein